MLKILFISAVHSPFKPHQGAEQRSSLLLKACLEIGDVDVIDFCNTKSNPTNASVLYSEKRFFKPLDWLSRGERIQLLYTSTLKNHFALIDKEAEHIIDSYANKKKYDFIISRYIFPTVSCGLLKYSGRLLVDVDDDPVKQIDISVQKTHSLLGRIFYYFIKTNIKRILPRIVQNVYGATFSNKKTAETYNALYLPNIPYYDVNNPFPFSSIHPGRLLFVGDMRYKPNIDAINWLLTEVFPLLKSKNHIELHIVGQYNDPQKKYWETYSSVYVKGFVDSIQKEYAEANIVLLPLRSSAGTCIKFLEAAQMGRPIISSPEGYSGYEEFFIPGEDFFVAHNGFEFATSIIELLTDTDKAIQIATSANKKLKRWFSSNIYNQTIQNIIARQTTNIEGHA